ncbi:DUF397 domain-containing protein [Streptomyces sp. 7-21]|jgi:hypothetical protein|uniref:DUF397 domain-containing protein n=1 Tax=Streptomyces sp. 7-21 TaxID=2802283 RepID=UPI00191DB07E|nr:DUF397 domain-containing protein [Streptomyces sp. 7-21]MBL1066170.1 DUF397 domain-containing protein [Streptomyces sp. 7-21]
MSGDKQALYAAPLDGEWITPRQAAGRGGARVRLMKIDGGVALGDAAAPERPALRYTDSELRAFLQGAKQGEFDHLLTG